MTRLTVPSVLVLLGGLSLALSLAATPLLRHLFRRFGVVDEPDGGRKLHSGAIPRAGGVAVAVVLLLSYCILSLLPENGGPLIGESLPIVWKVLCAASIAFVTGLLDDVVGLRPWQKLVGQTAAGVLAYELGIRAAGLAGVAIPVWLSFPITVAWLVACSNAFNLIDGMDGLACGAGIFATLTVLTAALITKNVGLAVSTVPLFGALAGVLRYNYNPASVFLGDSGTLSVGFILGCMGIVWSYKATTFLAMMAPVLALSLPLLDAALAIARRALRRAPIFSADRGHIHHRLLDRGLSPRRVVLVLYGTCIVGATCSLLITVLHRSVAVPVVVGFCIVAWFGIHNLEYPEFKTARQIIGSGTLRELVRYKIIVSAFDEALTKAETANELWLVLCEYAPVFGFSSISCSWRGENFSQRFSPVDHGDEWEVRIPIQGWDFAVLKRRLGSEAQAAIVSEVVSTIHSAFSARLRPVARAASAGKD